MQVFEGNTQVYLIVADKEMHILTGVTNWETHPLIDWPELFCLKQ